MQSQRPHQLQGLGRLGAWRGCKCQASGLGEDDSQSHVLLADLKGELREFLSALPCFLQIQRSQVATQTEDAPLRHSFQVAQLEPAGCPGALQGSCGPREPSRYGLRVLQGATHRTHKPPHFGELLLVEGLQASCLCLLLALLRAAVNCFAAGRQL